MSLLGYHTEDFRAKVLSLNGTDREKLVLDHFFFLMRYVFFLFAVLHLQVAIERCFGDMQGVTDLLDLRAVRSMELLCNGYLDAVGLQFGPATCSPSGAGCVKACFGALGDKVVLKLRQHRNQLKKQHACRCARIDIFCQGHQIDVPFFQFFKRFDELL